jgi:hypothetical protein
MKKWILPALCILVFASCKKQAPAPVRMTTKTLTFEVYAETDYSSLTPDVQSDVALLIKKRNAVNSTITILFDSTMPFRPLIQYPQVSQKMVVQKQVSVEVNNDVIEMDVSVRYFTPGGGYAANRLFNAECRPGESQKVLAVRL